MPTASICIDCGRTAYQVSRSRCADCLPYAPAIKRTLKPRAPRRKNQRRLAYEAITKTNRWKVLSQKIRRRDGKCLMCSITENLTVHHIEPVLVAPDLAFDPTNLITLCRSCHARAERAGR
jgi:5-methylcytosine-specific restriction protein A